ncbi:diguanylate cyclase [Candidatus Uhrbacteria bacterium]|nr:diguanylate cyclase [Candidatus Uhrbacteria bacterium]
MGRYPSRRPSNPVLVPAYEEGQLKLLRLMFHHLPDGVVATDPLGIITDANPAALDLFGLALGDLVETPIFSHLEDEYGVSLADAIGRQVSDYRFIRNRHVFIKRKDGTRRSCTLCVGPLVEEGQILRAFGVFRDRTELEKLVEIDEKTGLLNERAFLKRVDEQIRMARRKNEPMAMVYIDMRRFKPLNDRYGHAEGDRVLKKVGQLLDETIFVTDFKSRLHGDEYAVLLTRINRGDVEKAVAKLANAISFDIELVDPHTGRIEKVDIRADIGAVWREGLYIPDAKSLLELADRCMFTCKRRVKEGEQLSCFIEYEEH